MSKKILIFSGAYYPKHIGGAEVAIKEITDRLSPSDYEFHLVCNRYDSTLPKVEQIGNVKVHRIGIAIKNPQMADLRKLPLHLNKLLFQWLAFRKAKQLHKTHQFDGIWAMMAHSCGVPAGTFKQAFPDVKYVLTLQEGDPPAYIDAKMKVFGKAYTKAFSLADTIQVISSFLGQWATQKGFTKTPVLIPNAVNAAHFAQDFTAEELEYTRQQLGVAPGDVCLVTTSRLVHKNAVDVVIAALTLLPEHIRFVVCGTGPDEPQLKEMIATHKLTNRVLLRGHVDHAHMPRYLQACDIFVRPSRSEGMGNSFVEAMAAGLPVIATQEGGIADFLFDEIKNPDHPTTGWAVSVDNPEHIAAAVNDILARPQQVAAVVIAAKQMVTENYDWDLVAQRMEREVFNPLFQDT